MSIDAIEPMQDAAADLLLTWARVLAPHYGPSGSMDLDLADFPEAEGPSYYNQVAHYPFLLLSENIVPGATQDECVQFRETALANIGYILSITDDEFHTPHYSRGRDWGRHIGEWLNYFLLKSLQLMSRHNIGDQTLHEAMATSIQGAVEQLVDRFKARFKDAPIKFPGNHATWHGLLFYEAGQYFNRQDWVDFANDFFERYIVPTQRADGVWPEGDGIVVNYSMVTAQAVSLYAEHSDNTDARNCMARALGFFQFLSLPDGSSSVAADCRMRYSPRPFVFVPPSFLQSEAGRQLCHDRVVGCCEQVKQSKASDNGAQGLAFYATYVQYLFEHTQIQNTLDPKPPVDIAVGRIDNNNWTGFLSWQLIDEQPNRFILDTQHFLELSHKQSGYLIGGGNSKYMPRFSTIRRKNSGRSYIPNSAKCTEKTPTQITSVYTFGNDQIEVCLSIDQDQAQLTFTVLDNPSNADYEAGLMLLLKAGEKVIVGDEALEVLPLALINQSVQQDGFVWRDRNFSAPMGAMLEYPLIPHNPYTQHGLPTEDAYIGRLSFPINNKAQVIIT